MRCARATVAQNSKRMQRSVTSMLDWHKERERKLEERRQAKEMLEQSNMQAVPSISKKSEVLAEAARQRKKEELQRQHQRQRADSSSVGSGGEASSAEGGAVPDAADAEDVGTRLYRSAQEMKHRKEKLVRVVECCGSDPRGDAASAPTVDVMHVLAGGARGGATPAQATAVGALCSIRAPAARRGALVPARPAAAAGARARARVEGGRGVQV